MVKNALNRGSSTGQKLLPRSPKLLPRHHRGLPPGFHSSFACGALVLAMLARNHLRLDARAGQLPGRWAWLNERVLLRTACSGGGSLGMESVPFGVKLPLNACVAQDLDHHLQRLEELGRAREAAAADEECERVRCIALAHAAGRTDVLARLCCY